MEPIVDAVVYVIPQEGSMLTEWTALLSAVAAIFSVVIACIALWYSRKQVQMHETHNRLMATPHLSGWTHIDSDENIYGYTLENAGIGPAVITNIKLEVDGEVVEGIGSELIERAADIALPYLKTHSFEMFVVGEFIPAGKLFDIYKATSPDVSAEEIRLRFEERIKLTIQYESIFGETYTFDSSTD